MSVMRILKFLTTGIIGVSVNLGLFYVLNIIGVPYLAGSAAAFLCALLVGFVLQKYWTFEDCAPGRLRSQFAQYAALALANLVLNTGVVYVLVGRFGVHYLFAQAVGAVLVAVDSFIAYHLFIFRRPQDSGEAAGV